MAMHRRNQNPRPNNPFSGNSGDGVNRSLGFSDPRYGAQQVKYVSKVNIAKQVGLVVCIILLFYGVISWPKAPSSPSTVKAMTDLSSKSMEGRSVVANADNEATGKQMMNTYTRKKDSFGTKKDSNTNDLKSDNKNTTSAESVESDQNLPRTGNGKESNTKDPNKSTILGTDTPHKNNETGARSNDSMKNSNASDSHDEVSSKGMKSRGQNIDKDSDDEIEKKKKYDTTDDKPQEPPTLPDEGDEDGSGTVKSDSDKGVVGVRKSLGHPETPSKSDGGTTGVQTGNDDEDINNSGKTPLELPTLPDERDEEGSGTVKSDSENDTGVDAVRKSLGHPDTPSKSDGGTTGVQTGNDDEGVNNSGKKPLEPPTLPDEGDEEGSGTVKSESDKDVTGATKRRDLASLTYDETDHQDGKGKVNSRTVESKAEKIVSAQKHPSGKGFGRASIDAGSDSSTVNVTEKAPFKVSMDASSAKASSAKIENKVAVLTFANLTRTAIKNEILVGQINGTQSLDQNFTTFTLKAVNSTISTSSSTLQKVSSNGNSKSTETRQILVQNKNESVESPTFLSAKVILNSSTSLLKQKVESESSARPNLRQKAKEGGLESNEKIVLKANTTQINPVLPTNKVKFLGSNVTLSEAGKGESEKAKSKETKNLITIPSLKAKEDRVPHHTPSTTKGASDVKTSGTIIVKSDEAAHSNGMKHHNASKHQKDNVKSKKHPSATASNTKVLPIVKSSEKAITTHNDSRKHPSKLLRKQADKIENIK